MKLNRWLTTLMALLAALLACNVPTAQGPGATLDPTAASPILATAVPPPTSTPAPLVWFTDIEAGATLTAGTHPENRLPIVSLQIGFTPDSSGMARYFVLDADGMQVARVKNTYLREATSTTFNWTAWHGNGAYRLDLYKVEQSGRILSQQTINITVTGIPDDVPTMAQRFQAAYLQYFGLHLTAPIFTHFQVENPEVLDMNRWISTAYIDDTFYRLDIYDAIDRTAWSSRSLVSGDTSYCRPTGNYRILLVVVDYGNTTVDHERALKVLAAAETVANQRWSDYSASIGLTTPILHTETTQAYLAASPSPGQLLTVEQVKTLTGYDPADYDILVEVDLNKDFDVVQMFPDTAFVYEPEGIALLGGCHPEGAGKVNIIVGLDQSQNAYKFLERVVYDHEVVHLFGWEHQWPDRDGSGPAQYDQLHCVPYTLFGWTDTDGDGVIEVLSDHPYGLLR